MKGLLKYAFYSILFSTALSAQAQKNQPIYTIRSEVGEIDSVALMLKPGNAEGIVAIGVAGVFGPWWGLWGLDGYFLKKPANTYIGKDTIYETVGTLTIGKVNVPQTPRKNYKLDTSARSFTDTFWLDKVYGKLLPISFSGNKAAGYKSFTYNLLVPKEFDVRLETVADSSYKHGNRLSLKEGATLRWNADTLNGLGVLISFYANKSWNGWSYIVPTIEYGKNNVVTKDDGSYTISESDLQNFPNDNNVMIMITATRFKNVIVPNGKKNIQIFFEQKAEGHIVYRKD